MKEGWSSVLAQPVWRCQAGVYKENPCPTFQGSPSSGLLKTSRDQEQMLQSPSRPCVMILVLVQSKQALRPNGVKNILRVGLLHGAAGLCPLLFLSFLSLLLRRGGFWRHLWLCLWPPDRCEIDLQRIKMSPDLRAAGGKAWCPILP